MIAYGTSSVFFQFGPLRFMESLLDTALHFHNPCTRDHRGKMAYYHRKMPTAFLVPWPWDGTYFELLVLERANIPSGGKKRTHNSLTNTPFNIYSSLSWVKAVGYKLGSCQVLTTSNSHFFRKFCFWGRNFKK